MTSGDVESARHLIATRRLGISAGKKLEQGEVEEFRRAYFRLAWAHERMLHSMEAMSALNLQTANEFWSKSAKYHIAEIDKSRYYAEELLGEMDNKDMQKRYEEIEEQLERPKRKGIPLTNFLDATRGTWR